MHRPRATVIAVLLIVLAWIFIIIAHDHGPIKPAPTITVASPAPGPEVKLGPAGQAVLQDLQTSPAALEHVDQAATPPLAEETIAANDEAVEDGTYDAAGIVKGAAGAPARITCLTHQHGQTRPLSKIGLGTVHTTEGPNVLGLADVNGLCAWFRKQKLSATWIVDDEGNSAKVLELEQTPWTQWKWNTWSCSIEFVGYAARIAALWTDKQLREGARLMAQCFKRAGIPIRWAQVAGTSPGTSPRILRTGVISHLELGYNGGSHHDPGETFPRQRFLELMRKAAGVTAGVPLPAAAARACALLNYHRRRAHIIIGPNGQRPYWSKARGRRGAELKRQIPSGRCPSKYRVAR